MIVRHLRSDGKIGDRKQSSVFVPFHFFALLELFWGLSILNVYRLHYSPFSSGHYRLSHYFCWNKEKSIHCLHLKVTIHKRFIQVFSVEALPNLIRSGKTSANTHQVWSWNHHDARAKRWDPISTNTNCTETELQQSMLVDSWSCISISVQISLTFFRNQFSVLWMNNKMMLRQQFLKTHCGKLKTRKCWSQLKKIFMYIFFSSCSPKLISERKVPYSQEWDDMFL